VNQDPSPKLAHRHQVICLTTLAGGGDTIAAIEKFHVRDRIDYISTAGGAFLEYVEGKELPALAALKG